MRPEDIRDALLRRLAPWGGALPAVAAEELLPAVPPPEKPSFKGRVFLSEYHIRKALTPGATHLTIAKDAIVSPLASEWLAFKGIRIVRAP